MCVSMCVYVCTYSSDKYIRLVHLTGPPQKMKFSYKKIKNNAKRWQPPKRANFLPKE